MISETDSIRLFIEEAKVLKSHYPKLFYTNLNGKPCIKGTLELNDNAGNIQDFYEVEIYWNKGYPKSFPLVFEVGGRIPDRNIEWHVFQTDGHCCIKAYPEEMLLCRNGIKLQWFIEEELKPYFFNQSFREENGYYFHERSHGIKGTIESFAEIFKTTNVGSIIKILTLFKNHKEYKATAKCVCGSNKKYKKCHRVSIRQLTILGSFNIEDLITEIQSFQKCELLKNNL